MNRDRLRRALASIGLVVRSDPQDRVSNHGAAHWLASRAAPALRDARSAGSSGRGQKTLWQPGKGRGWFVAAGPVLVLVALLCTALWVAALGPPPVGKDLAWSVEVSDRHGELLRPYTTPEGRWRLPVKSDEVDPRFFDLLLAYEDKRFRDHPGVDLWAVLRAAGQLLANGRIVSGGSTLTMQVARLLEPREERSLAAKLRQAVRAIEIERRLSKDQILALYLSLAPYGGNLEGIKAAALAWFGKPPRRLTLGEAALLVALPQSPEARRPDRFPGAAKRARDRVLDRMVAAGVVEPAEIARAKAEPVPTLRRPMPLVAPHVADRTLASRTLASSTLASSPNNPPQAIRLTIEKPLQKSLEALALERAQTLGPEVSVAMLAVDHATGEVLARVGSADWGDAKRAGQVDQTLAVRSPGSTLKPFVYGLGFEDGFLHPETLVDDRPVRYGAYAPTNFDFAYQGTVTARRALQLSLNVPAVQILDEVGASRFTARLAQAGATLALPKGEAPGLAMGLGGTGVTLEGLVGLYAGLARQGTTVALTETRDNALIVPPKRLLDPVAAWYVADVLHGVPPPENAAGGRIAFKTGTSYGYRDAWAFGFDGRTTIGVWVGRPDGAPVPGLTGISAAAPILFDAFARRGGPPAALPPAPRGVVVAPTARLPTPQRHFRPGALPSEGAPALRIVFPPNGARLDALAGGGAPAALAVKIAGGRKPVTVLVDGRPAATLRDRRSTVVAPDGPGFVRLTVTDAAGASDSVLVRVQ
ncbi:Multimodular transpeptidase-transglycosylase [Rhodovulum sp. PH10]|uniref:penicillin-binding protein 1C n=1 Tax=Rhodovulum sp. PH10 TaxID=1187851 RepID=UPI00027C2CA5|nr:penicillin-binding protein 1C [Rhodovulum sp. PH10]EJW09984.1 Multimodular transpeptidase-transglycosylase [Rhodovulum sp. PH10]